MKELEGILPLQILKKILSLDNIDKLQEIRMKILKPLIVNINNKEIILNYTITQLDIKNILQRMSGYSLYAFEEEFKQGYITIKGGHRVGISGDCVVEDRKVKTLKNIYSLNIRIAHVIKGCANKIINSIIKEDRVLNTIVISPPKCGKTTLVRDLARIISNGIAEKHIQGKKITIIDERSEIAACYQGIPQMDIGLRTDVYDGCVKSEGIFMAIRSLSPDVIICDELGSQKEIEAVVQAFNSGVSLITTIHGSGIQDLYIRPVFKELIDNNILERVVILSNKNGIGTIEKIININESEEAKND
jgi:stage III sporulation protein AA